MVPDIDILAIETGLVVFKRISSGAGDRGTV